MVNWWTKIVDINAIINNEELSNLQQATRIQMLLRSVPEFVEDESILNELEDLFQTYPKWCTDWEDGGSASDDFDLIMEDVYQLCDILRIWCGPDPRWDCDC